MKLKCNQPNKPIYKYIILNETQTDKIIIIF